MQKVENFCNEVARFDANSKNRLSYAERSEQSEQARESSKPTECKKLKFNISDKKKDENQVRLEKTSNNVLGKNI